MNKQRRKEIDAAIAALNAIRGHIEDLKADIERLAEEEREFFDNMPENMQDGERGQVASDAADALEEAVSSIDQFEIDDIESQLENAKG